MTNPDLTLIGVLVDRSGSMESMRSDMEPALRRFLKNQKGLPGRCQVTLAQFDNVYEQVWTLRDIAEVEDYELVPRNMTALLDATGRFITDVGAELARRGDADRPAKVVIVVITDGLENASTEWTRDSVRALVTRQREKYSWEFVFLGANFDAIAEAGRLGVPMRSALTFDARRSARALNSMDRHIARLRRTGESAFSDEDRDDAKGPER